MYEHIVFDDFEFAHDRAGLPVALRPHADRQWLFQGLCDDRLADRLRGRRRLADQGDGQAAVAIDQQPLLDRAGRGGRRAERRPGVPQGRTPRCSSRAATWSCRCSTRPSGITCPRPEGAFYVYPEFSALIGKTTPDGQADRRPTRISSAICSTTRSVAAVQGAAFGLSPAMRIQLRDVGRSAARGVRAHPDGVRGAAVDQSVSVNAGLPISRLRNDAGKVDLLHRNNSAPGRRER